MDFPYSKNAQAVSGSAFVLEFVEAVGLENLPADTPVGDTTGTGSVPHAHGGSRGEAEGAPAGAAGRSARPCRIPRRRRQRAMRSEREKRRLHVRR